MLEHQLDDWIPFKVEIEQTKADDLDIEYIDDED